MEQLKQMCIRNIAVIPECTFEDLKYFSYRRDKSLLTKTMLATIEMKKV